MHTTKLTLHTQFQIDQVDERVFGGFLEHLGRAIYEGVYDPEAASADEEGMRIDVMDALKPLAMTAMRYPGGNFVSGYHWQDGIGPKALRPTVRELAWQSLEPNQFGTDEFLSLCVKMDWTPMMTVNLGTGTPEEARNWVEYCNCPTGSQFSDQRADNGHAEPYDIRLWCLGNEMDGPWQLGHVPADQYAIRAQQAAKMMKDTDPTLELVVCGSCSIGMSSYMAWDETVLSYIGDYADYISLHRYVGNRNGDSADYLAVGASVDQQIEEMDAVCKFVQAKRRSKKRTFLCFDEWNVWYRARGEDGGGKRAPHLLEEVYNLEDALVVAQFLNSFIRHADSVKIANIAQIVNVIAPIMTRGDDVLLQSIYWPFLMFTKRRDGVALQVQSEGCTYKSSSYGTVPVVDSSAILDGKQLHVFLVNRSLDAESEVTIALADKAISSLSSAELVAGSDPSAFNSFERPDVVNMVDFDAVAISDGAAVCTLPPLSVVALTFDLA